MKPIVFGCLLVIVASLSAQQMSTTQPVGQATGTNLHAVLDSTSTTAVTQATGSNLHAVLDSGTLTTVSTVTAVTGITNALPAGTNTIGATVPLDGTKATYSATTVAAGLVPGTAPTDIFTLTGSASKTIRITKLQIDGTATAATTCPIVLLKRSAANSSGTSTAPTVVAHDSTSASGTATPLAYTVNPTTGTLVGNVNTYQTVLPTPASLQPHPLINEDWGLRPAQCPVLRGTGQVFAVNLAGITAISGWKFAINIEWTEE